MRCVLGRHVGGLVGIQHYRLTQSTNIKHTCVKQCGVVYHAFEIFNEGSLWKGVLRIPLVAIISSI